MTMSFVDIEKQHLQLIELLDSPHSAKVKLKHLVCFINRIIHDLPKIQTISYFLELWPVLFEQLNLIRLSCMELEFYHHVNNILEFHKDSISPNDYETFSHILRLSEISASLILGDRNSLEKLLSQIGERADSHMLDEITEQPTPFDRISALLKVSCQYGEYEKIHNLWQDSFVGYSASSLLCLLVETDSDHIFLTNQAHFYPIHLDCREKPKHDKKDDLHFYNHLKQEVHQKKKLSEIVSLAKSMLIERGFQKVAEKNYSFDFSLTEKTAVYEGGSWNAGLLILAFCGMVEAYYGKPLIQKNDTIIVIGDLDDEGNLLPVDEEGLKVKIEAAFYAPVTGLVIPKHNLQTAEQALAELNKDHPNRSFQLFPISHVKEIYEIPLLFQPVSNLNFRKLIGRWIRSVKTKPVLWGTGLVALLVTLIILLLNLLFSDTNPVQYVAQDRFIHFQNNGNKTLWSHEFHTTVSTEFNDLNRTQILFINMDDDKENEVLLGTLNRDCPKDSGELFYYDHNGKVNWVFKASYRQSSPDYTYDDHYRIFNIKVQDILNVGRPQILLEIAHSPYYPSNITLLDLDKKVLGEYWHSGRFLPMGFYDVDKDSIQEIFLGGVNNIYRSAFLCVLDPQNMTGKSPDYPLEIENREYLKKGVEICYIKFPKSPFNFATWNDVTTSIQFHENRFIVIVGNMFLYDGREKAPQCPILSYEFDYNFNLLNVIQHDYYIKKFTLTFGREPSEEEVQGLYLIEYLNKSK